MEKCVVIALAFGLTLIGFFYSTVWKQAWIQVEEDSEIWRSSPRHNSLWEQERRQRNVKRACRNLKMNGSLPADDEGLLNLVKRTRLFFSDRYKLIACEIPKVGCSNFKKLLLVAEGLTDKTDPMDVPSSEAHEIANRLLHLGTLGSLTEIRYRLDNYLKLVMVREPAHRLLSAFRNKFEDSNNAYFRKKGRLIHNKYTNNSSPLTFEEFVNFITDSSHLTDPHWNFYHKLCSPCLINYDFIGKLETVDNDMKIVLNSVGMRNLSYPQTYAPSKRTNEEKMVEYYKGIPKLTRHKLYKVYRYDYEIFGYASPFGKI